MIFDLITLLEIVKQYLIFIFYLKKRIKKIVSSGDICDMTVDLYKRLKLFNF